MNSTLKTAIFLLSVSMMALIPIYCMSDRAECRIQQGLLCVEELIGNSLRRAREASEPFYLSQREISDNEVWATSIPTPLPTPIPMPVDSDSHVVPPTAQGKSLLVGQSEQAMYVYQESIVIRIIPVSTGLRMSYTPAFEGNVGQYVETLYGFGSLMDHAWYVTKATGNIYIHGAPYTLSSGHRIYEGLEFLGRQPSSHGCIRIHPDDAQWLADWGISGIPIRITLPDFEKWEQPQSQDRDLYEFGRGNLCEMKEQICF